MWEPLPTPAPPPPPPPPHYEFANVHTGGGTDLVTRQLNAYGPLGYYIVASNIHMITLQRMVA